ncbi:MAG: hypothetical protein ACR2MG_17680, partial [Pyrinomonadaceae bacterium]
FAREIQDYKRLPLQPKSLRIDLWLESPAVESTVQIYEVFRMKTEKLKFLLDTQFLLFTSHLERNSHCI